MMPNDIISLAFAFGLTPAEALAYFRNKGFNITWSWQDQWGAAHNKAFTVAKVMRKDILKDIHKAVDNAISKGTTFEQFKRELIPTLQKKGWWGKLKAGDVPGFDPASGIDPEKVVQTGSVRRLKTIFRVNTQVSYMAGRYKQQKDNAAHQPYWQYIQIERRHKRKEHAKLHLKVFKHNDPVWDKIYPPNGWNCGCRVRALSERMFKQKKLTVSNGSEVSYIPEDGWDYNPGKEDYKPDNKNYPPDIAKLN